MTTEVTITCPHCRRQYPIKVDPERLQRLKTRATCGRCGNAFDVAARVAAAAQAHTQSSSSLPQSPPAAEPPLAHAVPSLPPPSDAPTGKITTPPLARLERIKPPAPPPGTRDPDDMAELAREFADAAARFTPVLPRALRTPPATSSDPMHTGAWPPLPPPPASAAMGAPTVSSPTVPPAPEPEPEPTPEPKTESPPPTTSSPLLPPLTPTSPELAAPPAPPPPTEIAPPIASSLAELALDAADDFDASENTLKRARVAPAPPPTWIELADPGLDALTAPPSPTAALLDGILTHARV